MHWPAVLRSSAQYVCLISRSTTSVARDGLGAGLGHFRLLSAWGSQAGCAGARVAPKTAQPVLHTSQHSPIRRLERRNAAPRTPARAATRHTAAAAATTLCSTHDAIDATARMQQHNKPRAPTTNRPNARIFVRARASESPRRGRIAREEPAHALVWFCSRHLHVGIMLRVRTALQGFLSSNWLWGHHETSRTGHVRSTKAGRNFKSYQGDL